MEDKTTKEFASWLREYVFDPMNNILDDRIKQIACGPFIEVCTWPQYCVNGYRFHTIAYNSNKSTMNSGVCIKGSNYNDSECDYYGLLNEVIELQYPNPSSKRTRVVLFKCDWFDPQLDKGLKVHKRYGLVDTDHRRKFLKYETFILAQQSEQVYYANYPRKRKDGIDWWAVYRINAENIINAPELAFQEHIPMSCDPSMDDDEFDHPCDNIHMDEAVKLQNEEEAEDEEEAMQVDGEEHENSDYESQFEDDENKDVRWYHTENDEDDDNLSDSS